MSVTRLALADHERVLLLLAYYRTWGVLPSYDHMARMFGLHSKSPVCDFVKRMRECGYFVTAPDGRLAPTEPFTDRAFPKEKAA